MSAHGLTRAEWERRFHKRVHEGAVNEDDMQRLPKAEALEISTLELESWPTGNEDWKTTLPEEAANEQMANWADGQEPVA